MGFLIGFGDTPPLRVRLLPLEHFANVGERRLAIALHHITSHHKN